MFLVCQVILQNHAVKGLSDFIGRSPLRQVIILSSLLAIDPLVGKI